MYSLSYFRQLAEVVYKDIVIETELIGLKLRITLLDNSFIDIYLPPKQKGGFAFHWERRHLDGRFYRYDNYPDIKWRRVKTFPYHFHKNSQNNVVNAPFSREIKTGFLDFMEFARERLQGKDKK